MIIEIEEIKSIEELKKAIDVIKDIVTEDVKKVTVNIEWEGKVK